MPVRAIDRLMIPRLYGDGVRDDALGLQTLIDGGYVIWDNKIIGRNTISIDMKGTRFKISRCLFLNSGSLDLPFHGAIIHG